MNKHNRQALATAKSPIKTPLADPVKKPTFDLYGFVQVAFDHFNDSLFEGSLSQVILTFQREKNVMGYFIYKRWDGLKGQRHEIAINPNYFITHKPLEFFQTLVHEMCHQWQYEYGRPGRTSYHNKEWAEKMQSLGLMPSSTGEPGGKKTGQTISDYPIVGGLFYNECIAFVRKGQRLPYVDVSNARYHSSQVRDNLSLELPEINENNPSVIEMAEEVLTTPINIQFDVVLPNESVITEAQTVKAKQKKTYCCPRCGDKAWGKPTLKIICAKCHTNFEQLN